MWILLGVGLFLATAACGGLIQRLELEEDGRLVKLARGVVIGIGVVCYFAFLLLFGSDCDPGRGSGPC
jgi:hypothetical protein